MSPWQQRSAAGPSLAQQPRPAAVPCPAMQRHPDCPHPAHCHPATPVICVAAKVKLRAAVGAANAPDENRLPLPGRFGSKSAQCAPAAAHSASSTSVPSPTGATLLRERQVAARRVFSRIRVTAALLPLQNHARQGSLLSPSAITSGVTCNAAHSHISRSGHLLCHHMARMCCWHAPPIGHPNRAVAHEHAIYAHLAAV